MSKRISRAPSVGQSHEMYKQLLHLLRSNHTLLHRLALVFSVALLIVTTAYSSLKTSDYYVTSADALIATQQFSKGVEGNTVALPGSHSNILLMPVLYLQGHLPYRYKSFTFLNMVLVFTTVFAWALLLIRLFGRRRTVPILLLLSSLIFASVTFIHGIGNTTFRNLGFPLSLWFMCVIGDVLAAARYSRLQRSASFVSCLLFGALLAGDSFFTYVVVAPILLLIGWQWLRAGKITRPMIQALKIVLGTVVGAVLLKRMLSASGIIYFDYSFLGQPTILPWERLGPSIQIALRQLFDLQGASVFGTGIAINNLLVFFNAAVLLGGIAGLLLILTKIGTKYRQKKSMPSGRDFVLIAASLTYFAVLLEYILSGYVVTLYNGQLIDYMNTRYITFLPLLTVLGFVWLLDHYYNKLRFTLLIGLVITIGVFAYYPLVRAQHAYASQTKSTPSRATLDGIIGYLTANGVDTVVTDFWYGPPLRFWSSEKINYVPQINCNQPLSFDSREDWYTPVPGKKTGLIIDRGGLNYGYWSCSDEDLMRIYGKPVSTAAVAGIQPGETVKIWLYDYDVRERIKPFPGNR